MASGTRTKSPLHNSMGVTKCGVIAAVLAAALTCFAYLQFSPPVGTAAWGPARWFNKHLNMMTLNSMVQQGAISKKDEPRMVQAAWSSTVTEEALNPCPKCRPHASKAFAGAKVPKTAAEAEQGMVDLHNRVNASINQREGTDKPTDVTVAQSRQAIADAVNGIKPYGGSHWPWYAPVLTGVAIGGICVYAYHRCKESEPEEQ